MKQRKWMRGIGMMLILMLIFSGCRVIGNNDGSAYVEKPETEVETESAESAPLSNQLMDQLGDKMEGKVLVETGEETINGERCQTFALGTDTPEKFTAEEHYAISQDGEIYYMDVIQGPDWISYE